jgi:hypothetical protein
MLRRLFLPALVAAKLATASDELTSVSQRENALADAVRSKNKALLSTLTDKDFHVSWNQGTAIRNLETDVSRQAWIDDLNHLRIKSYEIEISKVWRADKGERNQPPCRLFATPESTARLIIPLKLELGLRSRSVLETSPWKNLGQVVFSQSRLCRVAAQPFSYYMDIRKVMLKR